MGRDREINKQTDNIFRNTNNKDKLKYHTCIERQQRYRDTLKETPRETKIYINLNTLQTSARDSHAGRSEGNIN